MYFPPIDKRLYYIYCNQLFRDIFRQASTCPFLHFFQKRRVNPTEEPAKAGYLFIRLLKQTAKRQCFVSYPFFNTSSLSGALGSGVDSGVEGVEVVDAFFTEKLQEVRELLHKEAAFLRLGRSPGGFGDSYQAGKVI